eukprot:2097262-Rhodomonas_salina.2
MLLPGFRRGGERGAGVLQVIVTHVCLFHSPEKPFNGSSFSGTNGRSGSCARRTLWRTASGYWMRSSASRQTTRSEPSRSCRRRKPATTLAYHARPADTGAGAPRYLPRAWGSQAVIKYKGAEEDDEGQFSFRRDVGT